MATAAKDAARKEAETIIRRIAGAIRSNDRVDASSKAALGIKAPAGKRRPAKLLPCPRESPTLLFKQAIHRSVHVPEHELTFRGRGGSDKPAGAARLELFVELVAPEDAVPERPGDSGLSGGGVHYLRSYVKSPIRLVPPLADRPMRVVYWGRWADASGDVGPFSAAAEGWVEGGSHHLMGTPVPGTTIGGLAPGEARPKMIEVPEPAALEEAAAHHTRVMVAVMQTQQRYLEAPREVDASAHAAGDGVKQLSGPGADPGVGDGEAKDGAWPGRTAA